MKKKFALISALCALFVMTFASRQVIDCCRYGLSLCLDLILPSLLPFFLISTLLGRLGLPSLLGQYLAPAAARLFRVSGQGATALFVGLTGGYPMGAAYIAELIRDGILPESEGERLLGFCNNSGPSFLVGAIGAGVFGSARIGLRLYGVHILAALLTGLLLRGRGPGGMGTVPDRLPAESATDLSRLLPDAVQQTVSSLLNVCGFVVCFSVFTGLLEASGLIGSLTRLLGADSPAHAQMLRALLTGFWELGSGIGALRGLAPTPLNLAAAAALAGWGGISVHFQTLAVLSDTGIKGALHTAGRLIHAILSFLLIYGISLLKS